MLNEEYFKDEEFLELLSDYEQSMQSGLPVFMDADDLADIADYYQWKGRYTDADTALSRALELQPDSLVAINYKIHSAISRDDFDEAEQLLNQIIDRDEPEYVYNRAEIWIAQDEVERADEYLRSQLDNVPSDERQDYVLDVANLYLDYGCNNKAIDWIVRNRQMENNDMKELLARSLFGLGDYNESERLFNELIDHDPFQKRYWNALANTQFMKEDYNEAITSSEYALAIDPDDLEGLLTKANGLYGLENYEEALRYYERYSRTEPGDEFALLHEGMCLLNLGRTEQAARRLEQAEAAAPVDSPYLVEILQELGFVYAELKMPDTALGYIDKTDKLFCDHADMNVIRGHILLANCRMEEAEAMFRKAMSETENTRQTLLRIVVSFYDNRYVETAYRMLTAFFDNVSSDWAEGYAYLALCCRDLKRTDEFMASLKKACELNPQEARQVLGHLFPDSLNPTDYYSYMLNRQQRNTP